MNPTATQAGPREWDACIVSNINTRPYNSYIMSPVAIYFSAVIR
jgi:hypothetical protein